MRDYDCSKIDSFMAKARELLVPFACREWLAWGAELMPQVVAEVEAERVQREAEERDQATRRKAEELERHLTLVKTRHAAAIEQLTEALLGGKLSDAELLKREEFLEKKKERDLARLAGEVVEDSEGETEVPESTLRTVQESPEPIVMESEIEEVPIRRVVGRTSRRVEVSDEDELPAAPVAIRGKKRGGAEVKKAAAVPADGRGKKRGASIRYLAVAGPVSFYYFLFILTDLMPSFF